MKILLHRWFLSAALSAALLGGCGEEPLPPTPNKPAAIKPLKERTSKEQVERLAQAAVDIINLADGKSDITPQQRDRILVGLFFDYMDDPPKGGENDPNKYYERLCTTSAKDLCAGIFPEDYKTVFLKVVIEKIDASLKTLKDQIPDAKLKETQEALLTKEPSFFAEALTAIKYSKGDRALYAFVDHPVNLPDRNSAVNIRIGADDKGNLIIYVPPDKAGPFKLPVGPAPSTPPMLKELVKELSTVRAQWDDFAKKSAGQLKPGDPTYEVDGYVEIQLLPSAPGWYIALILRACEEANLMNPVLIVRSTGDIPRLGMIPFPLTREFKDVLADPIKVKSGGETSKPGKELSKDLLAKLWPEDGSTVQDVAKALDALGGCKDNPCGYFENLLTVERWKTDD